MLKHASEHGYTTDSSTLEQPWRASICGFSEPMRAMLVDDIWPPDIFRDTDQKTDPLTGFSVFEARLHRQRGVPLDQYLGLTKYYRRAYLELVAENFPPGPDLERYQHFVNLFFDNSEISICAEWEKLDTTVALRQAAQTNRQLTNEKNRYLTIFESLNEPVILVDDAGRVTNLNLAAGLLFDEDAVAGQAYYRDDRDGVLNPQITALIDHAGNAAELEYELETRRGLRTFHVKIQRMLDVSGKFTDTVIILSDITDFRAAQHAAEAANRTKSAFLATMSHEIRTPINGILGIGELLREAPLTSIQTSYVHALISSGELLLELVNDVLDYSKLEAGETEIHSIVFSPGEMVERIARLSIGEAQLNGLQLSVEVDDDCPPLVRADGGKIQRILLNLVNNAIKFTTQGSVTIHLSLMDQAIRFAVEDTGPGIPVADQARMFEPFVQRSTETGDEPKGTGLGLAICRRLADALGASLTLETPRSGGVLFKLDCPISWIDTAETTDPAREASSPALDVLLVEDNAINAMVIEGFLESDGHRIDTVTSGEAALEQLGARAYELVLMDIRLQGVDGFETISRVRRCDDHAISQLPILVLTANQTDEVARLFASSGANAFLAKPFNRDDLRRAIQRAMEPYRARESSKENPAEYEAPVLDSSIIDGHREVIGTERTRRIVQTFLETASENKTALRKAVDKGDESALANVAHILKSGAGMTGLRRLGNTADQIEKAVSTGKKTESLEAMTETLCQQIDQATTALQNISETI